MTNFSNRRVWGPIPNYPNVLNYANEEKATDLIIIAGPCSIESEEQLDKIARSLIKARITFIRGGVFRAGTYPPKEFGFNANLLKIFYRISKSHGLKNIVEVINLKDVEYIDRYADAFQVGARHMQDYALLDLLSQSSKPVTLKRNMGSTLDEFLGAAEYLARGRCKPILIERGSSTYMNHVRWDLSISLIAAVKKMTSIPIIVDASHGTGRRDIVKPMTLAGISAGADGFLCEVHYDPDNSLSDSEQAYPLENFCDLCENSRSIKRFIYK